MNYQVTKGTRTSLHECIHEALATSRALGPGSMVHRTADSVLIAMVRGAGTSADETAAQRNAGSAQRSRA